MSYLAGSIIDGDLPPLVSLRSSERKSLGATLLTILEVRNAVLVAAARPFFTAWRRRCRRRTKATFISWQSSELQMPARDLNAGPITIRNLTATQLTLNVDIAKSSSESFTPAHDQVQLAIQPFDTAVAKVDDEHGVAKIELPGDRTPDRDLLAVARSNFIELHGTTSHEQGITPIYSPETRFLTLYELPDLTCWMRDFKDETSIAALSIPGTHNSPTYHWALPSVRCQAVSPLQQLENGVRFLDVRVQPHRPGNEDLYLVHGAFPIALTGSKNFRQLVDDVNTFLASHPSETVIISMKREGISRTNDGQLADIIETHYAQQWYTEPRIPSIGEVRGKIVLMRRFALSDRLKKEHDGRGWGLDAESWEDNTANCVHGQVCVQDFYGVRSTQLMPKKIEMSCAHFERAGALVCPVPGSSGAGGTSAPEQIYLNFLTASNFFDFRCWPENIAAKLNPAVLSFLCEKHDCGDHGDGGLGIVVCDWVGKHGNWDLVKCIVGMNARRLHRERGYGWHVPANQAGP
ncbi:hypothetical protein AMS68_007725 [Peltaster fructicola]|uniref:Phosphatidylinositol-specific phospholipase C X domain-containing protein n=1 Tax=Peltaster fructicola TaxID=286661 RepID=A0A6H0Y5U1_9PEZI|nr:hypothetical protein AMS68_007725 [Peltaster fructicola]